MTPDKTPERHLAHCWQQMDAADQSLLVSIFGSAEPEFLSQTVADVCRRYLGQEITRCEFWEVSVSFTIGLTLANGERVVVKCRSPQNITLETLQAVCQIQQGLANQGFPCPRIIQHPVQHGSCYMTIEALLDAGENCNAHDPTVRRAMASGLAQLLQMAQPWADLPHLPRSRFHHPQWEKPHNALFDFERTAAGAEWIDAIAAEAKAIYSNCATSLVVGHMDWSAKNMRVADQRLSAIYDWDSLRLEDERVIVGNAAKGFLVTGYVPVATLVPTPSDVQQFVQDYEIARGQPFTTADRAIIAAALHYSMAYTARCEHALDPEGKTLNGSFREALRHASAYCL